MDEADHSVLLKETEHQLVYCRYKARRQRELLADVEVAEVPGSKAVLGIFEELAAIHLADRDQLSKQASL